jgi:hypothetical protein
VDALVARQAIVRRVTLVAVWALEPTSWNEVTAFFRSWDSELSGSARQGWQPVPFSSCPVRNFCKPLPLFFCGKPGDKRRFTYPASETYLPTLL